MTNSRSEANYADIVAPEEMQDVRQWLASLLEELTPVKEAGNVQPKIDCLSQGWGQLQIGLSVARTPLCLAGRMYTSGLGTHAESEIVVRLPVAARRLTGLCGVNDSPETRQNAKPLVFSIEVNGKEAWQSGPQDAAAAPARIDVPLAGCRQFTLKVKGATDYAHADWVDLKIALANGQHVNIGRSPTSSAVFSFQYGGKPSAGFLKSWRLKLQRLPEKDGVILHRFTRTDPKTGLAVICELKEYTKFPVLEWGLRLKNTSRRKTPLLENIRSLDVTPCIGQFPYLNYWTGDYCAQDGYEPFRVSLAHGEEYRFAPLGGRPTNRAWPYYNLECPAANRGLIVVVGWSGQWSSCFRALGNHAIHITAGQELTHFKLLPGEEVRTPLSVMMLYRGDRVRSQNLWRRWMLAHNLPRPGGRLPEPILPAYTGRWFAEMAKATAETQIAFMDRYVEEGIKLDYWWMDAGWYPCGGAWDKTGTWEPDAKRFPKGLREIADHAQSKGIQTLVWFEPERVTNGTWLAQQHPDWLLDGKRWQLDGKLLNLGDPNALKWLIKHVSRTIREQGINLYRQDFNMDPLTHWRANDAPDRQGITEIRHVEGYLAYWTALRKQFPDMLIDSCASGGRRNDLETMRLSVPLHKTDYNYADLPAKQAFHHTLSSWLPYYGAYEVSAEPVDVYSFRSSLAPMTMLTGDLRRRDVDWRPLKRLTEEWRRITGAGYFYGDYYPLTPYTRDETQWIAWQFHRPDTGAGLVQAFRRKNSPARTMLFRLGGLDPAAHYVITDMDRPDKPMQQTGAELMESGLAIEMRQAPQAAVIVLQKTRKET